MSKQKVVLYALSTCGWCRQTHFFLEDNNIEHHVIAVDMLKEEEKKQAREYLGKFNPRKSFPTVVIDDKIGIAGFHEDKLREALGLSPPENPEALMKRLKAEAEAGGYFLNPDKKLVLTLMEGLLRNKSRCGYMACPCMESFGSLRLDKDIVCPCDYRDTDLAEYGACYCALYVSEAIAKGKAQAKSIPLRRPDKATLEKQLAGSPTMPGGSPLSTVKVKVWRCKVCGYLCANSQAPLKCPICGVDRERFELFSSDNSTK
jgi:ferredoxin-thioredoxin reductase catalytic subunit/glutaredoxin